ncbi:hypothetical protein VP1G_04492 [Cytospora mali]|uniref:Yeast cell wall synthesis Kre9/Knh1-like N-terminal domain-containing protein n=1 Tax=Cytospora mali TaxID=578113 RepID=A0A194UZY6_CYTMA|nr:hypothetical protein VP1G_04492 [Valsa mali var. pyri (nom. inval.)]
MKFTSTQLLAIAAALPSALAVEFTNSDYTVTAGKTFTLTWADASGPVTITLKDGPSTNLKDVEVLASGVTGTSFTWTPDSSLPSDTYAFEIEDSTGVPNYSSQFTFQGSASASASSSVASSTSVSSTLSSSTVTSTKSASSTSSGSSSSGSSSSGSATAATTSDSSTASASSTTTKSSSSSKSSTATSSTSTSTSTSTPVNTNDSKKLGSPLALIMGAVISLVVFN